MITRVKRRVCLCTPNWWKYIAGH